MNIKVYNQLNVTLTYQNFGSTWLCVLRGSSEDIETVFNGLFNFCATNGNYEFYDHAKTVAIFWSDRRSMRRFFFNQFFMPREAGKGTNQGALIRQAMRYAHGRLQELREKGHEFFMDFANKFVPETHGTGSVSAERPDADYKDSVLSYAYSNKSE